MLFVVKRYLWAAVVLAAALSFCTSGYSQTGPSNLGSTPGVPTGPASKFKGPAEKPKKESTPKETKEKAGKSALPSSERVIAQSPSASYKLSPSDLVMIKVYQEDDLERELRIANDGTIDFPLIGVVEIGGKTINEASDLIRKSLQKDYLVNPQVSINIMEYAKRKFTVLGNVNKPGSYEIPPEEKVDLQEAIAIAGGTTRIGNPAKVTITRVTPNGGKTRFAVDATKTTQLIYIEPEDIIDIGEKLF